MSKSFAAWIFLMQKNSHFRLIKGKVYVTVKLYLVAAPYISH